MDQIAYLEGISRTRPLTEQESLKLESAIRNAQRCTARTSDEWRPGYPAKPRWEPQQDEALQAFLPPIPQTARTGERTTQVTEIASTFQRTEQAIWSRIRHLRRLGAE